MPQLIVAALVGAGFYAAYRWVTRTSEAIAAELRRAEEELRERTAGRIEKDLGALEYDAAAGVYRPKRN